ncbi:DnaJ C-terminal domain-containing protein [Polynucleobacter paneuropaeus]|jgi:curved DNA-binding protein|uniref:J domain-containing protein n=1 Tax=Polynucleobacter paneuropaeus TaxID=2527775 RepID=A0A2Z4JRI6_9BURK|nr:DnaJ C-terminal domain-containing protein [Polynucleobacter paneuropaeus]AWW49401.1 J domain-containing protein [Polynucleobacter paneuropaeus]MBT8525102.1 DnaJ domain-containing protein [Polynucleobacter paneuropaeus]MBT8539885.1 DnaJ domain-containing protein [Polynucleobacter paneuropaeus]MBT8566292.1 DnaJ domain-containing protein [Polynucleobacter paneuropaeus]MBT8567598.1 DnaJ domain-containing protein [Polynucleobacter paneuropaeus]
MKFRDYYETLGVARGATEAEIKTAYRKLARKYHPDVNKEKDAEDRFKEIGEAYSVLKDTEKRAAYDQMGSNWKQGQDFSPPPNWNTGFEFADDPNAGFGGYGGSYDGDQSEFFESLFGRGRHRQGGRSSNARQGMHFKGQDHHAKILIDLADAYNGAKRTISLHMPTQDPEGHVMTQERKLDVNIPKGIKAGQNLRLSGQGGPGMGDGGAGDLYLEIDFHPSPLYKVDGKDVYLDLPMAPWEAALGTSLNIPTPAGSTLELTIPPNTKSGRKMRLKGKGIPSKEPGDFYVVPNIVLPEAQSAAQKAAYQELEKAFDFKPRSHLKG